MAEAHADYIIVALGEPSTGLLNRFFTLDFFSDACKSLTEEGSSQSPFLFRLAECRRDFWR